MLTDEEERRIEEYTQTLGLSTTNLPAKYKDSEVSRLGQYKMLKQLQQGIIPQTNLHAPILLGKNEVVLWCYDGVTMWQEKVKREMVGSHSGFSFRVMKGVTYRTGGFKGHPVEHSYMDQFLVCFTVIKSMANHMLQCLTLIFLQLQYQLSVGVLHSMQAMLFCQLSDFSLEVS